MTSPFPPPSQPGASKPRDNPFVNKYKGDMLNNQAQLGSQPPVPGTLPKPAVSPLTGLGGPTIQPPVNPLRTRNVGPANFASQVRDPGKADDQDNGVAYNKAQPQNPAGAFNPMGVGGTTQSAITPQNTLRGQQITPGTSAQTQATQGMVNQAAQGVNQASLGPMAQYQAAAAPYQRQGQQLFDQAAGSVGRAQGFGQQAAQALGGTGFGSYGAIGPTVTGVGGPQGIGGPSYTQGNVTLPGVTQGALSGQGISTGSLTNLRDLAFAKDTQGLRGRVGQGVDSLYDSPDRGQLARSQFDLLQEQAAPEFASQVRDLGKATGAFGRQGSGLVNSQLADLGTAAATSRDQQARQLSLDAADKTMSDRMSRLSGTQSGLGQLGGLDTQGNESFNQNQASMFDRNLGRDQAVNQAGLNQANFNLNRDQTINSNAMNQAGFNAGRDDARNQATFNAQSANANNALQASGMNLDAQRAMFDQQNTNRSFAANRDDARNDLAFGTANAFRGLGSDSLDQGRFGSGLASDAFGRGNTERDFATSYDQANNRLAFDRLDAMSGLQGQQFNQDQSQANDLRGERSYQDNLAEQANQNAINQYMAEQQAQNQGFNQWSQGVNTLGNLGYGSDPTTQLNNQGVNLANQGQNSVNSFANYLAQQQAMPGFAATQPNIPTWGPQYMNLPLDLSKIPGAPPSAYSGMQQTPEAQNSSRWMPQVTPSLTQTLPSRPVPNAPQMRGTSYPSGGRSTRPLAFPRKP